MSWITQYKDSRVACGWSSTPAPGSDESRANRPKNGRKIVRRTSQPWCRVTHSLRLVVCSRQTSPSLGPRNSADCTSLGTGTVLTAASTSIAPSTASYTCRPPRDHRVARHTEQQHCVTHLCSFGGRHVARRICSTSRPCHVSAALESISPFSSGLSRPSLPAKPTNVRRATHRSSSSN